MSEMTPERLAELRAHFDNTDTASDMEGGTWEMAEWGGWSIAGQPELGALHIGPVPLRKQVAMYHMRGNAFSVLGYFKSEQAAKTAVTWMDAMCTKANACGSLLHKLLGGKEDAA